MSKLLYKPEKRLHAQCAGPLLSGEDYQIGFYDAGIARQFLKNGNFKYAQYTLPIPSNLEEYSQVVDIVNYPNVEYALVDKDKLVFFVTPATNGWLTEFTELGYHVYAGEKTNKRLKSFHRATLLSHIFPKEELGLVIVEDTSYTNYDFFNDPDIPDYMRDPDVLKRLLDGGFVISNRIVNRAIQNLPVIEDFVNEDNEYYFDPIVRAEHVKFLKNSNVFNARIIMEQGFLKGNAFKADLPEGIDIITSAVNIKKEITYDNGYSFIAEPQSAKSKVTTDEQTIINLPNLFPIEDLQYWLKEEFAKLFNNAINDKLITANWKSFFTRTWKDDQSIEENESRLKTAYYALLHKHSGGKLTDSPWLFETTAINKASQYRKIDRNGIVRYVFPIPCSVYEQVISESLARMAGEEINVPRGSILRSATLQCHVVNDIDWLEMYESHGGHDQDDFFKIFYREFIGDEITGKKVVIARSPNGFGEYSIFDYVEGEWNPAWIDSQENEIRFPKVNGDGWPKRLSEALRDGDVVYTGLPSQSKPKKDYYGTYTKQHFLEDVNVAMSGGSIGKYVNAYMIWSGVFQKHRPQHLCSLEDAVDICINPKDIEDVKLIDQESFKMIREVIESGKPVDRVLWYGRRGNVMLSRGETVTLVDGTLTQMHRFADFYYKDYCKKISAWAQANARPSDVVLELGTRLHFSHALPAINEFRKIIKRENNDNVTEAEQKLKRKSWESIYHYAEHLINRFKRIEDRHDFVIALWSASLKKKTKVSGRISDQIVFNRIVYPYLLEALQFYGILKINNFVIDPQTKQIVPRQFRNKVWNVVNPHTGETTVCEDPISFQLAHIKFQPEVLTNLSSSVSEDTD